MKSIGIIFGVLMLIVGCSAFEGEGFKKPEPAPEERFVNPLFYKTLNAFSRNSRETLLPPTSLIFSNAVEYRPNGKYALGLTKVACKPLVNKENSVALKCNYINRLTGTRDILIVEFNLGECFRKKEDGTCNSLYVKKNVYNYNDDNALIGEGTYVVELD